MMSNAMWGDSGIKNRIVRKALVFRQKKLGAERVWWRCFGVLHTERAREAQASSGRVFRAVPAQKHAANESPQLGLPAGP
jgi:hypothetical protein